MSSNNPMETKNTPHKPWVKLVHWIAALSFLVLAFSGYEILMVHPRLYWGEVGNDLTPAILELPISRNYKHGGWDNTIPFSAEAGGPVSASRTFEIFNQNGWGRSLHFLAAWFLVITGVVYLISGLFTRHFRKHIWLKRNEFSLKLFWKDLLSHLRMQIPPTTGGPQYGILQKFTYMVVIFLIFPLAIMTGLTMSPAVTAAYPFLLKIFWGAQSARTLHFFTSVSLVLFLLVHVIMIIKSGFKDQILFMTLGRKYEEESTHHQA